MRLVPGGWQGKTDVAGDVGHPVLNRAGQYACIGATAETREEREACGSDDHSCPE